MKKMTVKQMVFEKAKRQFGQAVYYGDDSDELIVNPNTAESEFPWRYSYNLPTEEARIAEQQKMDAFYYELFEKIMHDRFDGVKCDMFEKIYIATNNICNGTCGFCSVGNDKGQPPTIIPDDIIEKIISELKEINFKGKISLHGVNEPLLDKRLATICKQFKNSLPDCGLRILTNGTMLTEELLNVLLPWVEKIEVHIYGDELSIPKNMESIISYCEASAVASQKVKFFLRLKHEILSQKGYGPCGRTKYGKINSGCIMPFTTLSIVAPGIVTYCDSDYCGKGNMGNIREQRIIDIWNSEKFNEYRLNMLSGRAFTEFCNKCDFF